VEMWPGICETAKKKVADAHELLLAHTHSLSPDKISPSEIWKMTAQFFSTSPCSERPEC